MSIYLEIAKQVLEEAGIPLSAEEILQRAYLDNLVPTHLYGRTQHKTLQARLSVDIRKYGDGSQFYRAARGVFFLNTLRSLPHLSERQQQGIVATPRYRELTRHPVLGIRKDAVDITTINKLISASNVSDLLTYDDIRYAKPKQFDREFYKVWVFVVLQRESEILTYRHGKYREKDNGFLNQRTIGFKTLLKADDRTFLDEDDHGIVAAGLSAAFADLGVSFASVNLDAEKDNARIEFLSSFTRDDEADDLVCVVNYQCPDWLEPLKRRLAINDLTWMSVNCLPNNINDFDEWSKEIIPTLFPRYKARRA